MKTNDNLVSNDISNIILNFSSMVKNFGFMGGCIFNVGLIVYKRLKCKNCSLSLSNE